MTGQRVCVCDGVDGCSNVCWVCRENGGCGYSVKLPCPSWCRLPAGVHSHWEHP